MRIAEHAARSVRASRSTSSAVDAPFRLSTFGLISPGKGLEMVIEALPAMIERHPETVYTIAGRTQVTRPWNSPS